MADVPNSKDIIAQAALAEFAKYGFAGARTDRIARRAGLNKQLIYYYFGSKAKLFEAVSKLAAETLSPQGPLPSDRKAPTEKLKFQLEHLFRSIETNPALATMLVRGMNSEDKHGAERWSTETVQLLSKTISEGQGQGFFRDDVDPDLAARQTVALLLGYFALGPVTKKDGEAPRVWLEATVAMVVKALAW